MESDQHAKTAHTGPAGLARPAASDVVAACEAAWRAIQDDHSELPDVVVVLGSGVDRGRLVKLGHWWAGRWIADGDVRGEVLLAGEALHLPASEVFEVLLHEAAHGLSAARRVKDSSRGGRYHNARFREMAEKLGLDVRKMSPYGWAHTALRPDTARRYAAEIADLSAAMRIARRFDAGVRTVESDQEADGDGEPRGDSTRRTDRGPATCGCGRKLRMAPSVLSRGPVICGICGHDFAIERGTAPRQTMPSDPDKSQCDGLAALRALAATRDGISALLELGAWYEAERAGEDRPLVATSVAELAALNRGARALLMFDGSLTGPAVVAGETELLVGEHVMLDRHHDALVGIDGAPLPPNGVIGTIESIDAVSGRIAIDFALFGRALLDAESETARALVHGYVDDLAWLGHAPTGLEMRPDRAAATEDPSQIVELGW